MMNIVGILLGLCFLGFILYKIFKKDEVDAISVSPKPDPRPNPDPVTLPDDWKPGDPIPDPNNPEDPPK